MVRVWGVWGWGWLECVCGGGDGNLVYRITRIFCG